MKRQNMNAEPTTTTPSDSEVETRKTEMTNPAIVTDADHHPFDASGCEQVDPNWCEAQGFSSRLFKQILGDGTKIAYVVLLRSARGDFALNEAAFGFLAAAREAGEIADGYVVLSERKELKPIRQLSVGELAARLKNVSPMEGQFGDFWWINEQLRPAGNRQFAAAL